MEIDREQVIKDLEWKKLASSRMGSVTVSAEQMESYYNLIKELTEENKDWQKQLITTEEKSDKAYYDLACEVEDLRNENERFRDENTLLLNFMLPDYKIPGMMRTQINLPKGFASANIPANKYCISGRALKESLKKVKSDILREFAKRLKYTLCINNEENTEFFDYQFTLETIDQIERDMLEDGYDT